MSNVLKHAIYNFVFMCVCACELVHMWAGMNVGVRWFVFVWLLYLRICFGLTEFIQHLSIVLQQRHRFVIYSFSNLLRNQMKATQQRKQQYSLVLKLSAIIFDKYQRHAICTWYFLTQYPIQNCFCCKRIDILKADKCQVWFVACSCVFDDVYHWTITSTFLNRISFPFITCTSHSEIRHLQPIKSSSRLIAIACQWTKNRWCC